MLSETGFPFPGSLLFSRPAPSIQLPFPARPRTALGGTHCAAHNASKHDNMPSLGILSLVRVFPKTPSPSSVHMAAFLW